MVESELWGEEWLVGICVLPVVAPRRLKRHGL